MSAAAPQVVFRPDRTTTALFRTGIIQKTSDALSYHTPAPVFPARRGHDLYLSPHTRPTICSVSVGEVFDLLQLALANGVHDGRKLLQVPDDALLVLAHEGDRQCAVTPVPGEDEVLVRRRRGNERVKLSEYMRVGASLRADIELTPYTPVPLHIGQNKLRKSAHTALHAAKRALQHGGTTACLTLAAACGGSSVKSREILTGDIVRAGVADIVGGVAIACLREAATCAEQPTDDDDDDDDAAAAADVDGRSPTKKKRKVSVTSSDNTDTALVHDIAAAVCSAWQRPDALRMCTTVPSTLQSMMPAFIVGLCERGVDLVTLPVTSALTEQRMAPVFAVDDAGPVPSLRELAAAHLSVRDAFIDLSDPVHAADQRPLLEGCNCYACVEHTRAYVHHLTVTNELLGSILLEAHARTHYMRFFEVLRRAMK